MKEKAILKALQRHPAKDYPMHADFFRVEANKALKVSIPLHFINEESCVGVKLGGGRIQHTLNEIEVSALPADLPEFIEVDMADVDLGDVIIHIVLETSRDNYALEQLWQECPKVSIPAEYYFSDDNLGAENTNEYF